MILFELSNNDFRFPDIRKYKPEELNPLGLIAVGGDLDPNRIVEAYTCGTFPWFSFRRGELHWYCPRERFVIFPNEIHVSHSMRTLLNKGKYRVTFDRDFPAVIDRCCHNSNRFEDPDAWLGPDIIKTYTELHKAGICHSVEVWDEADNLVGGLYGASIFKTFIGESMFSDVPSGSKIALIALARFLAQNGYKMIDCQIRTEHLESMGGRYISFDEYTSLLWYEGERKSIDILEILDIDTWGLPPEFQEEFPF